MKLFVFWIAAALTFNSSLALGIPRAVERSTILVHPRQIEESYDYVIVGGGTAGLTVADRLSEDGETTVLVIEYGEISDSAAITTLQAWFQVQSRETQFFYNITSVPQPKLGNRTSPVLVAKVVGGGSAVNAMMTIRGSKQDFDQWGAFFRKTNSSTWSWEGLLPYFKKALNFVPPAPPLANSITHDAGFWGNMSGVYAGWPSFQYPEVLAWVDTWKGMPGVEFPPDSGAGLPGVYWYPTFMSPVNVTRSYAKTGHYDNVRRDNYHLLTSSKVVRILANGTTIYGVEFVSPATGSNAVVTVRATREVILAAGAIHTPQIMQLSGFGPKALLDSANITTVVDLPGVGQNFQDHLTMTTNFTYRNFEFTPSPSSLSNNATFRAWADEVWAANKSGPYSLASGNVASWLPFPVISSRSEEIACNLSSQDYASQLPPNTHHTVIAGYRAQMLAMAASLRGNRTAFFNMPLAGRPTVGISVNLHALSRGTVNINPQDLEGEPTVDYRAMSNPLDGAVMADMLRYLRRYYLHNPATADYQALEITPGANVTSDADLIAYISRTLRPTMWHPSGTCAMMPRRLGGVVDEKLRVYGTKNLRIVDASIMPTLVGANPCQAVYAIAEKAADIIKASV